MTLPEKTADMIAASLPEPSYGLADAMSPCATYAWLAVRHPVARLDGLCRQLRSAERQALVEALKQSGIDVMGSGELTVGYGIYQYTLDGIATGIPGGGDKPHLLLALPLSEDEMQWLKVGEPTWRYDQAERICQAAMRLLPDGPFKTDRAAIIAVCPQSGDVALRRVRFAKRQSDMLLKEAVATATADRMPTINWAADARPDFCASCPYGSFCFGLRQATRITCLTCAYSTLKPTGEAFCVRTGEKVNGGELDEKRRCHAWHFDLTPYDPDLKWSDGSSVAFRVGDGFVLNGEGGVKSENVPQWARLISLFGGTATKC